VPESWLSEASATSVPCPEYWYVLPAWSCAG